MSSSSIIFILYRHKQQVRHIHRTNISSRSSPGSRATMSILVLMQDLVFIAVKEAKGSDDFGNVNEKRRTGDDVKVSAVQSVAISSYFEFLLPLLPVHLLHTLDPPELNLLLAFHCPRGLCLPPGLAFPCPPQPPPRLAHTAAWVNGCSGSASSARSGTAWELAIGFGLAQGLRQAAQQPHHEQSPVHPR
ncbi:hypothetical protein P7K49_034967 [Saguinus oedipus]|uniref:Vomeronasal type-1 receptor n=1 Tax=Saguinus oedipus TaxID=9490 RepID=A0ABQ9TW80_SAGOE|nr:hypothetical protein P7K49_034967 [Saguinus oedipus]